MRLNVSYSCIRSYAVIMYVVGHPCLFERRVFIRSYAVILYVCFQRSRGPEDERMKEWIKNEEMDCVWYVYVCVCICLSVCLSQQDE